MAAIGGGFRILSDFREFLADLLWFCGLNLILFTIILLLHSSEHNCNVNELFLYSLERNLKLSYLCLGVGSGLDSGVSELT